MPPPHDAVKAHLSRSIPFAAYTGVVVETVGPGTARATLAARPETANHIGTPHGSARSGFTQGEHGAEVGAMNVAWHVSRARA